MECTHERQSQRLIPFPKQLTYLEAISYLHHDRVHAKSIIKTTTKVVNRRTNNSAGSNDFCTVCCSSDSFKALESSDFSNFTIQNRSCETARI